LENIQASINRNPDDIEKWHQLLRFAPTVLALRNLHELAADEIWQIFSKSASTTRTTREMKKKGTQKMNQAHEEK